MKKMIRSIIESFKKMMEDYDKVYSELYQDPDFVMMEGYTFASTGFPV